MQTERKSSMKRKIFNSRTLALILVLAMAVSLFTISASAATSESLSGHGSNISTIFINGTRATSGTTYTFTKTTESNQLVRIIVQDGSAAPYVTYLKIS